FMQRLLSAQKYNFLFERSLFSSGTLQPILGEFCAIIADDLRAVSCTIHLQLYDPDWYVPSANRVELFISRRATSYSISPDARATFERRRAELLRDPMVFPYP